MSIDVALLAKICETPGAPGFEKPVRDLVLKEIKGLVDEVRVDAMGNVIALRKGKSSEKKVMAAAHMDEIGFIVTHIDEKGFVRFNPLGGFDPKTLSAQRVIVHGKKDLVGVMGSKPIHIMLPEERNKPVKLTDFFIDLGLPKSEVVKLVEVGDSVTRERALVEAKPQERCTELGKGVGIKIMDSSTICDRRMVAYLKSLATEKEIAWQPEILAAGGTDTAGLQRMSPGGSIAGAISIPTRHIHQVIEMSHKEDIQAGIDLLVAAVCGLDGWDWSP